MCMVAVSPSTCGGAPCTANLQLRPHPPWSPVSSRRQPPPADAVRVQYYLYDVRPPACPAKLPRSRLRQCAPVCRGARCHLRGRGGSGAVFGTPLPALAHVLAVLATLGGGVPYPCRSLPACTPVLTRPVADHRPYRPTRHAPCRPPSRATGGQGMGESSAVSTAAHICASVLLDAAHSRAPTPYCSFERTRCHIPWRDVEPSFPAHRPRVLAFLFLASRTWPCCCPVSHSR